jgi:hypothetical protein
MDTAMRVRTFHCRHFCLFFFFSIHSCFLTCIVKIASVSLLCIWMHRKMWRPSIFVMIRLFHITSAVDKARLHKPANKLSVTNFSSDVRITRILNFMMCMFWCSLIFWELKWYMKALSPQKLCTFSYPRLNLQTVWTREHSKKILMLN